MKKIGTITFHWATNYGAVCYRICIIVPYTIYYCVGWREQHGQPLADAFEYGWS